MRYLIISDLHANLPALEAVLADAAGSYDAIICCGDIAGYGAQPNEVVDWVRGHVLAIVRGNHDKAAAGLEDIEWFNPAARAAIEWTRRQLSPANLDYLRQLAKGPIQAGGFEVFHGSPIDEDEYLGSALDIAMMVPYLDATLAFFGHTHLQAAFESLHAGTRKIAKPAAAEREIAVALDDKAWYAINPGSVGQPRDRDPRAAYALFSPASRLVQMRRVGYDIAAAQRAIRRAGLPEPLAVRLASGR